MSVDEDLNNRPVHEAMDLHRRHISVEQVRTFEQSISEIFTAFELDLTTPVTKPTPQRFRRAMFDATEGYESDPKLLTVFETECRGGPDCRLNQVIEEPIQFFGLCEHRALLFHGHTYLEISRTKRTSTFPSSRASCACLPSASLSEWHL